MYKSRGSADCGPAGSSGRLDGTAPVHVEQGGSEQAAELGEAVQHVKRDERREEADDGDADRLGERIDGPENQCRPPGDAKKR